LELVLEIVAVLFFCQARILCSCDKSLQAFKVRAVFDQTRYIDLSADIVADLTARV